MNVLFALFQDGLVPGLRLIEDFVTEHEEKLLAESIVWAEDNTDVSLILRIPAYRSKKIFLFSR
jgi:hypothetical protein